MPIHDRTKAITAGAAALEYFTDRYDGCRLFAAYLNEDPGRERILFFHGDGGNGKSLLLKCLRERYCKRIDSHRWAALTAAEDAEFATLFEASEPAEPVPSALLDFAPLPGGDESHQQAFAGLLKLRRALAGHGLHFPLFDFACLLYLQHTEGISKDRLRTLFPSEEIDLIMALAKVVLATAAGFMPVVALGKAVLSVGAKYLGARPNEWFTLWMQQRGLDAEQVEELRRMDPDRELVEALPGLFAEDLNAAMTLKGAPARIVLFFDSHEAFWGERSRRELAGDRFFERDEWLRRLLGALALEEGIVALVAGREPPRWDAADEDTRIPGEYLDLQLVGSLSDAYAGEYLERVGVEDMALRECLLEYARFGENQIHPLYLGLCADIVWRAKARRETLTPDDFRSAERVADKGQELIRRLLSYVDRETDTAVRALSAARAFNRDIYLALGQRLHFEATVGAFDVLRRFSFMWGAKARGQDWYRIHDLLRRLFAERPEDSDLIHDAHVALEQYYRDRAVAGDEAALAEAIYHANRLDWERGATEWVEAFDQALQLRRYGLCSVLIEVRNELRIDSSFMHGSVSRAEGEYFASLARYNEARQEYEEAIAAYDGALAHEPDDVAVYNNKGNVLARLGNLQAGLSEHGQARGSYEQAIASYDAALDRAPDLVGAHNNKGNVLARLGDLQARLSEHGQARQSYEQAIASYDAALDRAPDDVEVHNNKGNVLQSLGDLQARLLEHGQARGSYEQAVASYDAALDRAPDLVEAHNNKGNVLRSLGDLQARLSEHGQARQSYRQAIASYDAALDRAPDYVNAHNNKGNVLLSLGNLQAGFSEHGQARGSYEQAVASYDAALDRAPDDVYAHNNKGLVLASLGDLQAGLSEHGQARGSYEQAIASYDAALDRAPDYVNAHNNKGNVLQSLGDLQAGLSEHGQARESYEQAVASYDAALDRAPDYVYALNNKGLALQELGELHAQVGEIAQAVRCLRAAVAEWVRSLEIAPGDRRVHESQDRAGLLLEYLEMTPEQLIAGLPGSVRDAVENEGSITFEQAFTALPPLEQRRVAMALLSIQAQRLGSEDEEDSSDLAAVLEDFEPFLEAVAAVAVGYTAQQHEIEQELANLETNGWRLTEPVQRIWAGERDETVLTAGLDAQDTALVKQLLQILGERA